MIEIAEFILQFVYFCMVVVFTYRWFRIIVTIKGYAQRSKGIAIAIGILFQMYSFYLLFFRITNA